MVVAALLVARLAHAHGTAFGAVALAPDPVDPDTAWAVVEGWGLALTRDGGATWAWHCEESLVTAGAEPQPVLSVLARAPGSEGASRAWVGTRTGLLAVDSACGVAAVPGLPDGAYVAAMGAMDDGAALVLATGPVGGGAYRCDDTGCAPGGLVRDGLFPKSLVRARGDGAWWATTVDEDTLAARLWTSADGRTWEELPGEGGGALWPDGDVDPRVLEVDGARMLVWARTRADGDVPRLLRTTDGGRTWRAALTHGAWQDPAPGFLRVGDVRWLGSVRGARTWRSTDDGATWEDVSLEAPAVRCGATGPGLDGGTRAWLCADHIADGYDVALQVGQGDEGAWTPVGCLQEALAPACAAPVCDVYAPLYAEAGALGGSECALDPVAPPEGCGCASGGRATPLAAAWIAVAAARRRRRVRARS